MAREKCPFIYFTTTAVAIAGVGGMVCSTVLSYPLNRVINIRKAQGGLSGYQYPGVFRCLYRMPHEQGGFFHVWRGAVPAVAARVIVRPATFVINDTLGKVSLFRPHQNDSPSMKLAKPVISGSVSGAVVSLLSHPLGMVSLRMQLDLGGGTIKARTFPAGAQGSVSVMRQIASSAGVVSGPFSLTGGLYRGWMGMHLATTIQTGIYFGVYDIAKDKIAVDSLGFLYFQKFLLGLCVSNLAASVAYPFTVGAVRAQAAVPPKASFNGAVASVQYRGAVDAMFKVATVEGVGALWRGFGLSMASSVGGAIMLVIYDFLRTSG